MQSAMILGLLIGLGASIAGGQQAGSSAAGSPADALPATSKVYDVGPDLKPPELLPVVWEVMPADACNQESDGEVTLALVVDASGAPRDIAVVNAKVQPLEAMALRVVGKDRFKPGTLNGEQVAVKQVVVVRIEGCFDTKIDGTGKKATVFRLTAQPVQNFWLHSPTGEAGKQWNANLDGPWDTPGMYKVGGEVSPPVPLNTVEAEFTDEASRKKIHGMCMISVIVDANGRPQHPRVIQSLDLGLDLKAIEAVNKYLFKPAMKNGVPVPVMIKVEVNFRICKGIDCN
jgi:TonB family protein